MSKWSVVLLLFGFCFAVSCQPEQSVPSALPPVVTETPVPTVMNTAVSTPIATNTPLPPTTIIQPGAEATQSPTLTPTPDLPPANGRLYFLWDPETKAGQYGVLGPFQNRMQRTGRSLLSSVQGPVVTRPRFALPISACRLSSSSAGRHWAAFASM
jgi:hypothetical protein